MTTYEFTDKWGDTFDAYLFKTSYMDGSIAVLMVANPYGEWEEYADVTVNLCQGDTTMQTVDTNNCPWVTKFLEDNGLANPTGIELRSGYCSYPMYEFTDKFFAECETCEE